MPRPRPPWARSPGRRRRSAGSGVSRTRAIRRPSSSVTVNRRPSATTLSPSDGQPAELVDDEAGHRLVRALGQLEAGAVLEVLEVEQAVDLDVAVDQRARGLLGDVVLVVDVADDLLDQVLEGDDAVGAAVLVDDDGEVVALAAHLRHRGQHPLGARHHLHLAGDLADPDGGAG